MIRNAMLRGPWYFDLPGTPQDQAFRDLCKNVLPKLKFPFQRTLWDEPTGVLEVCSDSLESIGFDCGYSTARPKPMKDLVVGRLHVSAGFYWGSALNEKPGLPGHIVAFQLRTKLHLGQIKSLCYDISEAVRADAR